MVNESIKEAVKIIYEKLGHDIKWALVGSANMKLQGMEVEPHDLDIVTQHKDLEKVSEIFRDYSASGVMEMKKTLSGKPAWEMKAAINDVEIQFFGGDENDVYVSKLLAGRIIYAKLDGIEIPCFTLEAESEAYRETNRERKARLIHEFLSARRGD